MANLGVYTKATVYWNGQLLSEQAKVSIKRSTGAQQVKTTSKGFAGMSPGAAMLTASISNAVPAPDFELNPGSYMTGLVVGELTVFAAGRTLTTKGFITDDNFSGAIDAASNLDFEFVGQFADWV